MLDINGKNIDITRGNVLPLEIDATNEVDSNSYEFQIGDVIRFKVMEEGNVKNIFFEKDFTIEEVSSKTNITITANEMKIGELSSDPVKYWYEIELNPDTDFTQTIIGYDLEEGAAILTLLPEGGDGNDKTN